jgi:glycosyltransferase involved in cell wall biosynthesis
MYNRYSYYRRALKEVEPDVIIAFTHNIFLYTKLWSWGYKGPIIASDHTSMGRNLGKVSNYIRHNFYKKADIVTILTEKDARILGNRLPNKEVVYNPVTFDVFNGEASREKKVLCVGRKSFWSVKGFDRIIKIWGELSPKYPDWKLEIVGASNADCDAKLQSMIAEAGVENSVIMRGNTNNIVQFYRSAEIFALPSRVEGFPLVLVEAMSQGCACVSFSMQGAVSEIINDGEDGIIVEDGNIEEFSARLEQLMKDAGLRQQYSTNAKENVSRFSIASFTDKWETLIARVLK